MHNEQTPDWWQRADLCYQQQHLHFAGHKVADLARQFGTPSFVYLTSQLPEWQAVVVQCLWFIEQLPSVQRINIGEGLGVPHVASDQPLDLGTWAKSTPRPIPRRWPPITACAGPLRNFYCCHKSQRPRTCLKATTAQRLCFQAGSCLPLGFYVHKYEKATDGQTN